MQDYPTALMRALEAERRRPIRDLITDAISSSRSFDEAAVSLGVTRVTLYSWCRRLDIRSEQGNRRIVDPEPAAVVAS